MQHSIKKYKFLNVLFEVSIHLVSLSEYPALLNIIFNRRMNSNVNIGELRGLRIIDAAGYGLLLLLLLLLLCIR